MLICGVLALIGVAFWSSSKRVLPLAFAAVFVIAAGIIYAVERAIVTPAEEAESLTQQLCLEFKRQDPATLEHFSPTVPELRSLCEMAMQTFIVEDDLQLSDFQTRMTNDDSRAIVHFRAKATVTAMSYGIMKTYQPARFELTWAREGADWKIIALKRLNPFKDGDEMDVMAPKAN
jgi:hypothetical protein